MIFPHDLGQTASLGSLSLSFFIQQNMSANKNYLLGLATPGLALLWSPPIDLGTLGPRDPSHWESKSKQMLSAQEGNTQGTGITLEGGLLFPGTMVW